MRNDVPARIGLYNVNERFGGFYRSVELEATPDVYVDDVWARDEYLQFMYERLILIPRWVRRQGDKALW